MLDVKAMTKLGMGALLGVAQGSTQPGRMVIMRWNGGKKGDQPVAFIGKGVCFDTGGISIKGAGGMEDMKGDMGGAACVVGLMHALAARKAKVNVVGAIGLVENMPDGNAQRPGDIVTSMSGQTIEIINTDAEGRLVLADVLWYVAKKYKPKFMVDLATLTGAIMVALGTEYAGMFSNNDELSERLSKIGNETGERVWRMPLGPEYDKMIDSQFADVKNAGVRNGGSITAAQFLQRFVDNTPWAHLDIAGTAMGAPKTDINQSWGSGYGVRLLDRLVARALRGEEVFTSIWWKPDDGSPVLPSAEHVARECPAALAREIARARLARGRAIDLAGAHRRARRASVDLHRRIRSCRTPPGAPAMRRTSPSSSRSRRGTRTGPMSGS